MVRDTRLDPLPSELRRRRLQAAREAESGIEWLDGCPVLVGVEVVAAVHELSNVSYRVFQRADRRMPTGAGPESVSEALLRGDGSDEERLDALAAVVGAFVWLAENDEEWEDSGYGNRDDYQPKYDVDAFVEVVNDRLLHGRVDWLFEDGRFQERGNYMLHSEVLRPATLLLADDPAFARASAAFQGALTKLSKGEPEVALTEGATALQEFLRGVGAEGGTLKDQVNAAASQNIISGEDRLLIKNFTDWANADRSNRGNAHNYRAGDVTKADAWLMMHVVAALMVRLSNREPRDIVAARELREAEAAAHRERHAQGDQAPVVSSREADPWEQSSLYDNDTPF